MMAEHQQIWQGTVWTGVTSEEGERICPEVLPWADPYIAMLVEKHRWQAVLFALQPDTDEDQTFWDDEALDDPIPPLPADLRYADDHDWPLLAPLAPFSPDEATDEVRQGLSGGPAWERDEPLRARFLNSNTLPGFLGQCEM